MSAGEEKKKLGNEAFAAKKFDEAIGYYTEAIAADRNNHVYYSNRSASYAGKKKWEAAALDAKECIKLNPSFLKGYYRLATAQLELKELHAAMATLKQGLNLEPDNEQLSRLLRIAKLQHKKQSSSSQPSSSNTALGLNTTSTTNNTTNGNVDSSLRKEIQDLQDQLRISAREYNIVKANIQKAEKEKKMNDITKTELNKLPSTMDQNNNTKIYRGIGKMFMINSSKDIHHYLDQSILDDEKKVKELSQKLTYLEKRMKSQQQNIIELTKSTSSE